MAVWLLISLSMLLLAYINQSINVQNTINGQTISANNTTNLNNLTNNLLNNKNIQQNSSKLLENNDKMSNAFRYIDKFNKLFCQPNRTDSDIVRKVWNCEQQTAKISPEAVVQNYNQIQKIIDICMEEEKDSLNTELKDYTKVNLINASDVNIVKRYLYSQCSPKMSKCKILKSQHDQLIKQYSAIYTYDDLHLAAKLNYECAFNVMNITHNDNPNNNNNNNNTNGSKNLIKNDNGLHGMFANVEKLDKLFCQPNRTDTDIVRKVRDCKQKTTNQSSDLLQQYYSQYNKIIAECMVEQNDRIAAELSTYTKVDWLANTVDGQTVKRFLYSTCSMAMSTCKILKSHNNPLIIELKQKISLEQFGKYASVYYDCAFKFIGNDNNNSHQPNSPTLPNSPILPNSPNNHNSHNFLKFHNFPEFPKFQDF
ncbi:putative uncharacterized protein DDB_G0279653 [Oppia nitens]|uniref:putative uncharacterized protein DDB_G0279653 n=1 Tax=Oppia nitens TaxID=1686743 RepID=UPI0023DA86B2|nr:putative uncharacterized protein DDB_G0279653 [Oppia nitens]